MLYTTKSAIPQNTLVGHPITNDTNWPLNVNSVHIYSDLIISLGFNKSVYIKFCFHLFILIFLFSQNDSLTLDTPHPDVTRCFQRTVMVWVPSGFLFLLAAPILRRLTSRRPVHNLWKHNSWIINMKLVGQKFKS